MVAQIQNYDISKMLTQFHKYHSDNNIIVPQIKKMQCRGQMAAKI